MSRAFTVGHKTYTQTAGRGGARVNASKKPPSSRTGAGDETQDPPSQQATGGPAEKSGSSLSSKSSHKNQSPLKPRVVTLADISSGEKKSNTNRTRRTTPAKQPAVRQNCQTSGVKTDKSITMWEDNPQPHNNKSSNSLRGSRNVVSGRHVYSNYGTSNTSSSNSSPGIGLGDDPAANTDRREGYQLQGGYTLVQPNPKKRDKLQTQRSSELERLEAYKEKKQPGHVSIKPTSVGGSMSEEAARKQQQRKQQDKKYEMIRKRQQWADEKKQREEQEYAEKKAKAREQANRNRQRELERQRELQAKRQDWIARGGLERFQSGARDDSGEYEEENGGIENSLNGLEEMFPFKSPTKLHEMLMAADGDVHKVIDWLSD